MPERCSSAGTTAHTVTGPAHDPRPTSSIPTTTRSPAAQHFRSTRSVGNGPPVIAPNLAAGRRNAYDEPVRTGTRVEVRTRFESRWTRGFEIADCDDDQGRPVYKVRRRSDGSILPVAFPEDDLREERHRGTWWIG